MIVAAFYAGVILGFVVAALMTAAAGCGDGDVLALVVDVYEVAPSDVKLVAELRADRFDTYDRNRAFRVFYDLQHYRESSANTEARR